MFKDNCFFEEKYSSIIKVTGPDKFSFLQGIISNDIEISISDVAKQICECFDYDGEIVYDQKVNFNSVYTYFILQQC